MLIFYLMANLYSILNNYNLKKITFMISVLPFFFFHLIFLIIRLKNKKSRKILNIMIFLL
jgi:hypothetical protein